MQDPLEPEHITQLRSLQRFVAREMPRSKATEWDRQNHFPREVFDKLAELGMTSMRIIGGSSAIQLNNSYKTMAHARPSPIVSAALKI